MKKSLYETLCEQNPGREVRLVLKDYRTTYESFGFTVLAECVQKSECDARYDVPYYFMLAPM